MSHSNCCILTCIQISQEACQMVWYSHLFQNFPQFAMIHRMKSFVVINKAEINIFLELSCFFCDPMDAGDLISGSSAFSKPSSSCTLETHKENFEHYFASLWDEWNCTTVWKFIGTSFFLGLEWKLNISSPVATAGFSKFAGILSAALSQHHLLEFETAQLEFHHLC